jgi:hypothetical protein
MVFAFAAPSYLIGMIFIETPGLSVLYISLTGIILVLGVGLAIISWDIMKIKWLLEDTLEKKK